MFVVWYDLVYFLIFLNFNYRGGTTPLWNRSLSWWWQWSAPLHCLCVSKFIFYFYTRRHIVKHNLHLIQARNLSHKPVWLMTITSRARRIRRLVSIQLINFIKWCETRKTERLFLRDSGVESEFGYQRIFLHILASDAEESVAETGNQSTCYDKGIMFANKSNRYNE